MGMRISVRRLTVGRLVFARAFGQQCVGLEYADFVESAFDDHITVRLEHLRNDAAVLDANRSRLAQQIKAGGEAGTIFHEILFSDLAVEANTLIVLGGMLQ